ncbi:class I SAM-dependent methyltransferase [Myceligenerans pegani]|uniref:Class I SAM-dependent methyltransferase n=1 Tax=Myceligenerans pegani TaxID=2776917 RepID=A0ABR9N106_9MICO|nr:class I SAM-dependent methyltransferase [Myceligenerans sp. TRM 65318]MBE1876697.1 class I SAM-dependent methyltransferase [Myceligenerans sp. TRM 65318]MBE3018968.1 class I SAM-dependent methyltransferase [Myceligenerans sp. TRM 65318]
MNPPGRFELTRVPGVGPDTSILGELAGSVVVEIGCGSGHNIAHLVAHHDAVGIGIDHDPAKIHRARTFYGHIPGLQFMHDDAEQNLCRLAPGSVDVIVSIFGALSFTDDLRSLLRACSRALAPHGRLLVTLRADDDHDQVTLLRHR